VDAVAARFFDGLTAAEQPVTVALSRTKLIIGGLMTGERTWPLADLNAIDSPVAGIPLRLGCNCEPAARLIIPNDSFATAILAAAPHLKPGLNRKRIGRFFAIALASVAGIAIAAYLILVLAPRQLAFTIPDAWRDRLGAQIEASFTDGMRVCNNPAGLAALNRLTDRMREGNPGLPDFTVKIYDAPVVNAFALPGGRIAVFDSLIAAADTPEEVAGVIAHELGHVANRHSEAQLIRAVGLQLMLSLASGGTGGNQLGEMAGVLTILRYSRVAEEEADNSAQQTLSQAAIDPLGLKRFFEKIQKLEGASSSGIFDNLASMISTHPLTEDRIAAIKPLIGEPRTILSSDEWQALRGICG
jgi:Zn-dependent protease with chaperone function